MIDTYVVHAYRLYCVSVYNVRRPCIYWYNKCMTHIDIMICNIYIYTSCSFTYGIYELQTLIQHLSSRLFIRSPVLRRWRFTFLGGTWSSVKLHPRFFRWKPEEMMLERRIRLPFSNGQFSEGQVFRGLCIYMILKDCLHQLVKE